MSGGDFVMIPMEDTISTLKNMDVKQYTVVAQLISEISDKRKQIVLPESKLEILAEESMQKYSDAYARLAR